MHDFSLLRLRSTAMQNGGDMSGFAVKMLWFLTAFCVLAPVSIAGDLCVTEQTTESLAKHLWRNSVPKAGRNAGVYYSASKAHTLMDCIASCCAVRSCNVLLFVENRCMLVECDVDVPHGCEPHHQGAHKSSGGDGDADSFMISVRSIEETSQLTDSKNNTTLPVISTTSSRSCTEDTVKTDCGEHEVCGKSTKMCRCEDGFSRDHITDKCVAVKISPEKVKSDTSCEVGLVGECAQGEVCTAHNSRSRAGYCTCLPGYSRHPSTHVCEKLAESIDDQANDTSETQNNGTSTVAPSTGVTKKTSIAASLIPTSSTVAPSTATLSTTIPKEKKAKIAPLVVSAGDDKVIRLPINSATLSAYVLPKDTSGEYAYEWSLPLHPDGDNVGVMAGMNTATLQLSKLTAGRYTFKVTVSAKGKYGEGFVNVTVLPPVRQNKPPIAVIKPAVQTISQLNDVILDGSESTDDDKVISYLWSQVSGPLSSDRIDPDDLTKQMLVLKNLVPGEYRFKLTVTDSDKVENSTFANVTVTKETDYPPKANAGSNVIMSLPKNSVTLYGNQSTDDKGIASYEWIKKPDSDKLAADMTGVRTPFLHLDHLQEGDYTFTLKVTDTGGQVSTADVHVFVKPEHNKPPVARPGKDRTVLLPVAFVALDGSNSTDDQQIERYQWTQLSGPSTASIDNGDRAIGTASALVAGVYEFQLLVEDAEKLQSTASVRITVKQDTNQPPKADAGGDHVVMLPAPLVTLDGSASSDDKTIVSYAWTRHEKSLAAGVVLNGSDHQAVLQLTDLVSGRYVFTLQVVDGEGLTSEDTAALIVKPHVYEKDLIEITLDKDIKEFSQADEVNLKNSILLLLHKSSEDGETKVKIEQLGMDVSTGSLLVQFYVCSVMRDSQRVWQGTDTVTTLRKRLRVDPQAFDIRVTHINTVVCQNNCSHHGRCSQRSKLCVCEPFWMENPFRVYLQDGDSNCEWSILYVIIIAFVQVIGVAGLIWLVVCLCRRWRRWKPKKRRHYSLLHEEDSDRDKLRLNTRTAGVKRQTSSLMLSESDLSSHDDEEETIFTNQKMLKGNGHVRNGFRSGNVKT